MALKTFFEKAPIFCYIVSPEGRIQDINRTALRSLGYKKQELLGKQIIDLYTPPFRQKAKKLMARWKRGGKIANQKMAPKANRKAAMPTT